MGQGVVLALLVNSGCGLYWDHDSPPPDPGDPPVEPPLPGTEVQRSCVRAMAGGNFLPGGADELFISYVCDCCGIIEHLQGHTGAVIGGDARGDFQDRFQALLPVQLDGWTASAIAVGENGGNWVFSANGGTSLAIHRGFDDIKVGDVDGDTRWDIVLAGDGAVRFVRGVGGYSFPLEITTTSEAEVLTGLPYRSVARAQLGGSAATDLFFVTANGELGVAIQTSTSPLTFTVQESATDSPGMHEVLPLVTADLDGDGIEDVAGSAGHVFVRSSKTGAIAFLNQAASALATGDIDGDGTAELLFITANHSVVGRVEILADGSLTSSLLLARGGEAIAVADLDGDDRDDIALVDKITPPGFSPEMTSTISVHFAADL